MGLIKRQPGDRRWGVPDEFPLMDSSGAHVITDRRSSVDQRRAIATLEDLLILFSELPAEGSGHKY